MNSETSEYVIVGQHDGHFTILGYSSGAFASKDQATKVLRKLRIEHSHISWEILNVENYRAVITGV